MGKSRKSRRKRGGATDAELKACNERLIAKGKSVMKARIQCINKDGKAGLEKNVSTQVSPPLGPPPLSPKGSAPKGKSASSNCVDDMNATYGSKGKGNCANLQKRIKYTKTNPKPGQEEALKKFCAGEAGKHCKASCIPYGQACPKSGGRRKTRKHRRRKRRKSRRKRRRSRRRHKSHRGSGFKNLANTGLQTAKNVGTAVAQQKYNETIEKCKRPGAEAVPQCRSILMADSYLAKQTGGARRRRRKSRRRKRC